MKKIHTPINRSIGNQEIRTPNSDGTFSSTGAAVMRTLFSVSRLTRLGSFGAYVVNPRLSLKWPLILLPWIVTSVTRPLLTSLRKSEKARVDPCGPRLEEVWKRLKSATRSSPITIHRARFLLKLFTVRAFPCQAGHRAPTVNHTPPEAGPRSFSPSQDIRCAQT